MSNLRTFFRTPEAVCVHGGLDPAAGRAEVQQAEHLIWGVDEFPDGYRGDDRLLAGLTKPEQAEAVAGGAQAAAGRARELRARKSGTSPGSFGVLGATAPVATAAAPTGGVVFLWVDADSLSAAIAALRSRGFELSQPAGSPSAPEIHSA